MVWRGTERFGLGEQGQADAHFYVVAAYDPRGNMEGGYEANVQRPSKHTLFLSTTHTSCFCFIDSRIRNNELPISTTNMFDIKTNSRYNLRSNNRDFTLDKPNTNFMKKSISYAASSAWNKLPLEAKCLGITSQKFKSILDHYSPA